MQLKLLTTAVRACLLPTGCGDLAASDKLSPRAGALSYRSLERLKGAEFTALPARRDRIFEMDSGRAATGQRPAKQGALSLCITLWHQRSACEGTDAEATGSSGKGQQTRRLRWAQPAAEAALSSARARLSPCESSSSTVRRAGCWIAARAACAGAQARCLSIELDVQCGAAQWAHTRRGDASCSSVDARS